MLNMEFKNWLIKNSVIAGAIILALIVLILFIKADISKRTTEIKLQRQDLTTRLSSLESLTLLKADSKKAEALRAGLESSLPTKDSVISFTKTLENFAKSNGVGFGFAFESEVQGTENYPSVNSFTITSSGSFQNFLRFLKAIEQSRYYVNFSYLDISQKAKEYGVIIKGKVFSQ